MSSKIELLCDVNLNTQDIWASYLPLTPLRKFKGTKPTTLDDHDLRRLDAWIFSELEETIEAPTVARQIDEVFDLLFLLVTSLNKRLTTFADVAACYRQLPSDVGLTEAEVANHVLQLYRFANRLQLAHSFIRTSVDLRPYMNCAHSFSDTTSPWMHRRIDREQAPKCIADALPRVLRMAHGRILDATFIISGFAAYSATEPLASEHMMVLVSCVSLLDELINQRFVYCYFRWLSKQHSRNREIDRGSAAFVNLTTQLRRAAGYQPPARW